jgi:hypothetical protein
MASARLLADMLSRMDRSGLAKLMSISDRLAEDTRINAGLWGKRDRPRVPALFGFTGPVYTSLDPGSLTPDQMDDAQKRVNILSGLYGVLRPLDLIEAYRLEMGHRLMPGKAKNLTAFWKTTLTQSLNDELKPNEPVVSLAAQEYLKALDLKALKGPVISPVFKEQRGDGTFRSVVMYAKKARGELVRYALVNQARTPQDLMGFNALGWKAAGKPPKSGPWLFTRPVNS